MRFLFFATCIFGILIVGCATKSTQPLKKEPSENVVFIPSSKDELVKYEVTVFEPASITSVSSAPIVVIAHGTSPSQPQKRERSIHPTEFFLSLGWTVFLPMRRGYSNSTGTRVNLTNCDLTKYGLESASDIDDVINWLSANEKYKSRKIILIGQSTGGLAVMAYSSFPNNKASAIINFHGGMRPQSSNDCRWQARIDAFKAYAPTSHPTSMWIYTDNDHSSNSVYIGKLYKEFLKAGGKARLAQFGPFKDDGHYIFGDKDGEAIWQSHVMDYLHKQHIFSEDASGN